MPINVEEKYFGYDGFIWFIGVVEDINDPEQISRVKVRILGHHTADKKSLKTNDIMWAMTLMPTTSASVSGVGFSPSGLVNGSYVVGFWMDGEDAQRPVIIGSWHGIPQELADVNLGFNDPGGVYPKEVNEPDTNKLARGQNTIVDVIDDKINNPASVYKAVYPNNKVFQSTSGHTIELDDTTDGERIRVYHKSGSFVEFHPNGDVVQSNKNKWQITTGNDSVRVVGDVKIFVDGSADIDVGGDTTITCDQTTVNGNVKIVGELEVTKTSTASDHISGTISGKGHTHTIVSGSSAGETKEPS